MRNLMKENLGCYIGDYFYGTIFYADDVLLMSGSVIKMQKILDMCYEYGVMFGINFNPAKSKWFCTDSYNDSGNVSFSLNSNIVEHELESVMYLGVKLKMKHGCLIVDVNDRIKKFNSSAYDVLLNSSDLSEVVRCEIIVKKCLPVLLFGVGCYKLFQDDLYKLHVAYRKIYRFIFRLSLRAHISEFLEVFGVKSVFELFDIKESCMIYRNLSSRFKEISFLTMCMIV
jgi:hypothetical protein